MALFTARRHTTETGKCVVPDTAAKWPTMHLDLSHCGPSLDYGSSCEIKCQPGYSYVGVLLPFPLHRSATIFSLPLQSLCCPGGPTVSSAFVRVHRDDLYVDLFLIKAKHLAHPSTHTLNPTAVSGTFTITGPRPRLQSLAPMTARSRCWIVSFAWLTRALCRTLSRRIWRGRAKPPARREALCRRPAPAVRSARQARCSQTAESLGAPAWIQLSPTRMLLSWSLFRT